MKALGFLAVLFLAAACFSQTDSGVVIPQPVFATHAKPVDTSLDCPWFSRTFMVAKNKTVKMKLTGNGIDTAYVRSMSCDPIPLSATDTLKSDSMLVEVYFKIVKFYGLKNKGGPLLAPRQ